MRIELFKRFFLDDVFGHQQPLKDNPYLSVDNSGSVGSLKLPKLLFSHNSLSMIIS
jgi:hypothetical protein